MKHILVIIVLLVFTLAPALAQAPAPAKETPLLSIATKVALPSGVNEDTYFWFSDHQVLFFRLMPLTKQQLRDLGPVVSSLSKGTEVRRHVPLVFDNKTRKLTPLEPFFSKHPAAFLALGGPDWSWTAFPSGSQDSALSHSGEWLLWLALSGKKPVWIASRIDGSKEIKWPASGSEPVWAPDSHHWVELRESESAAGYDLAVIHDLRTPSLNRKVKIDPSEDGITQGVTANGSLVLSDFDDEHPNLPIKINVCDLSAESANMQSYTITPPTKLRGAGDVALSPAGDKLAWLFDNDYETLDTKQNGNYLLCTSDLDGTHMQIVGSMQGYLAPKAVNHQLYFWPQTLRWLPDGKHVSFIFRNNLYTVPVP